MPLLPPWPLPIGTPCPGLHLGLLGAGYFLDFLPTVSQPVVWGGGGMVEETPLEGDCEVPRGCTATRAKEARAILAKDSSSLTGDCAIAAKTAPQPQMDTASNKKAIGANGTKCKEAKGEKANMAVSTKPSHMAGARATPQYPHTQSSFLFSEECHRASGGPTVATRHMEWPCPRGGPQWPMQ